MPGQTSMNQSACPRNLIKRVWLRAYLIGAGGRGNDLFLRPIISSKLISVLFNQTALNQYEVQKKKKKSAIYRKEAGNLKLLRSGASSVLRM